LIQWIDKMPGAKQQLENETGVSFDVLRVTALSAADNLDRSGNRDQLKHVVGWLDVMEAWAVEANQLNTNVIRPNRVAISQWNTNQRNDAATRTTDVVELQAFLASDFLRRFEETNRQFSTLDADYSSLETAAATPTTSVKTAKQFLDDIKAVEQTISPGGPVPKDHLYDGLRNDWIARSGMWLSYLRRTTAGVVVMDARIATAWQRHQQANVLETTLTNAANAAKLATKHPFIVDDLVARLKTDAVYVAFARTKTGWASAVPIYQQALAALTRISRLDTEIQQYQTAISNIAKTADEMYDDIKTASDRELADAQRDYDAYKPTFDNAVADVKAYDPIYRLYTEPAYESTWKRETARLQKLFVDANANGDASEVTRLSTLLKDRKKTFKNRTDAAKINDVKQKKTDLDIDLANAQTRMKPLADRLNKAKKRAAV
jgi:Asp-tRNA(Asn)/Glu-tRNA(Gln) amidotransferase C subunit